MAGDETECPRVMTATKLSFQTYDYIRKFTIQKPSPIPNPFSQGPPKKSQLLRQTIRSSEAKSPYRQTLADAIHFEPELMKPTHQHQHIFTFQPPPMRNPSDNPQKDQSHPGVTSRKIFQTCTARVIDETIPQSWRAQDRGCACFRFGFWKPSRDRPRIASENKTLVSDL